MRTLALLLALFVLVPAGRLLADDDAPSDAPNEAPRATDPAIEKLIADLDADDFRVRERASQALAAKGEAARDALEHAAKHSESVEARWRAQQVLRRLDGRKSKPLGTPETPEVAPGETQELDRDLNEAARRLREALGRNNGFRSLLSGKVKAPGLELVPEGPRAVRLVVTKEGASDAPKVYRGASLEAILDENPELREHESMKDLRAKSKMMDPMQIARRLLGNNVRAFPGGAGFTSVMSINGMTVRTTPDGVHVTIPEKDENGNEVRKEYKGKTLDEIKKEHPEVAKKLEGFGMGGFVRIHPQVFGPAGSPIARRVAPRPAANLGAIVAAPEEALTVHLGLERGHGALVRAIQPNSQAADLGLERHDVIVKVNDTEITDVKVLQTLFAQAAAEKSPLTVEIIRHGQPATLTR